MFVVITPLTLIWGVPVGLFAVTFLACIVSRRVRRYVREHVSL